MCLGNSAAIRRQSSGVSRRSETVVGTRAGLHYCSFTPDSQGRNPVGEACRCEQSSTRDSVIVVVERSSDRSAAKRTQENK